MNETLGPGATLERWLEAMAAPTAAPGGGAAAALGLALAAALVEMVAGLTLRRQAGPNELETRHAVHRAAELRHDGVTLARADASAFAAFERALALPKSTPEERTARAQAKRAAYREGARVQQEVLQRCVEAARLASGLSRWGLASARADAATALHLARAGARSAEASVRVDLEGEVDEASRAMVAAAAALLAEVETL
ncbi:MAG: cyclodeaminase/cyclohydrolase family protein [Gemmatimonadales bacterium]